MSKTRPARRAMTPAIVALALAGAMLGGCSSDSGSSEAATFEGKPPSGYVEMKQVQVAYIGSGGGGSGVLTFRGRDYPFTVAGLGIGGIGVSTIDAQGEVYNLTDVAQFAGAYGQGRYGAVIGSASTGDLWLRNPNNVVMHLRAKREGLMLSLGGDAVVITMN